LDVEKLSDSESLPSVRVDGSDGNRKTIGEWTTADEGKSPWIDKEGKKLTLTWEPFFVSNGKRIRFRNVFNTSIVTSDYFRTLEHPNVVEKSTGGGSRSTKKKYNKKPKTKKSKSHKRRLTKKR
jgi:hypothetical protein